MTTESRPQVSRTVRHAPGKRKIAAILWTLVIGIVLGSFSNANAQTEVYVPYRNQQLWDGNPLYIGAEFVYVTTGDILIWLKNNEAGWTGSLSVINPANGSKVFLFTNHGTPNQVINLQQDKGLTFTLGDTVRFVYEVTAGDHVTANDRLPKFTGLNLDPASPFYSQAGCHCYDHRWSVAGRVNDTLVEFGFEDMVACPVVCPPPAAGGDWWLNSDLDFDDIVFQVTSLVLNVETVDTVQFTGPADDHFDAFVDIFLSSSTLGARIFYSLDGHDPLDTLSPSVILYPGGPLRFVDTTTIKAVAFREHMFHSNTVSATFYRNHTQSQIKIMAANGDSLPGGYLTGDQTAYTIDLKTNYFDSPGLSAPIRTKGRGDDETIATVTTDTISPIGGFARRYRKSGNNFRISASTDGNNWLEANQFDTIIVTWTNPLDPADVTSDTAYVRPANTVSTIRFSTTSGGSATTSFTEGATPVYIIVTDQYIGAGITYRAVLTTPTGEKETIILTKSNNTTLIGQIPAVYAAAVQENGTLQINLQGNQITAEYTDPLYTSDRATATANYAKKNVADPVIASSNGASFPTSSTITLTTATAGASIRYTLNGTNPTHTTGTLYTAPFLISSSLNLRAIAYITINATNNYTVSNVVQQDFTSNGPVADPLANPPGTYFTTDTTVTLSTTTSGASIYYTTNGSTPTTSSNLYTGAITISATTTLKFYAVKTNYTPSNVKTEVYTKRSALAPPTANASTCTFLTDTTVVLTHTLPNVRIFYTLDGSTPTSSSQLYTSVITIANPTTLKAIAYPPLAPDTNSNKYLPSTVLTETYTPILTIAASPTGTAFNASVVVSLSSNSAGASIYYTTDGTTNPTTVIGNASYLYTGPLTLVSTTTLQAVAVDSGWQNSSVLSQTYTRNSTPSTLVILDAAGNPFTGDIILSTATQYTVRVSTNYSGTAALDPDASTSGAGDTENLTLSSYTDGSTYARVYQQAYSFGIGTASADNGILTASFFDTITVTWTNPLDPGDVVSDQIYVRPADTTAVVYFSASSGGPAAVNFAEAATPVYVVVEDQAPRTGTSYTAVITTPTGDTETITLTYNAAEGEYRGQIPASYAATGVGDNTLQINYGGEQITVTYTDPIYNTDSDQATAHYAAKTVADPVFSLNNGQYFQGDTTFNITTATPGASIRYTVDGTDPSNTAGLTALPLQIFASTVVKAVAYLEHSPTNFVLSNIVQVVYNSRDQVGTPHANPTGRYFSVDTIVQIVPDSLIDSLYYTTDGSDPISSGTRQVYSAPLTFSVTTVLKFYGARSPATPSIVVTETYTKRTTLEAPVALPATTTFTTDTSVTLSTPSAPTARIYYTLDGTEPTLTNGVLYSGPITISGPKTLKARAYSPAGSDAYVRSAVTTERYTPILTLTAAPAGQAFNDSVSVTLTSNAAGASIYYTTDNSAPDTLGGGTTLLYSGPIKIANTTVLKAVAVLSTGWRASSQLTETYTRSHTDSKLEILDSAGTAFPGNIITGANTVYSVRVSTNYSGPTPLTPTAVSENKGDSENLTLTTRRGSAAGFAHVYRQAYPFKIISGGASAADTLETSSYDTIIVTWTNPYDGTDVVADTVYVQPVNVKSVVYFSTSSGGSAVATYGSAQNPVYIVVEDQVPNPAISYSVQLTTASGDAETVALTISGNKLIGQIPASFTVVSAGDGTIQINLAGEQIIATYADPLYSSDVGQGIVNYPAKFIGPPSFIPVSGTYFVNDTSVTLVPAASGDSIIYTLDNSTPSLTNGAYYTGPIAISANAVIKAIAYEKILSSNIRLSEVVTGNFFKRDTTPNPKATPEGTYFSEDTTVVLTAVAGANIYYTTNGSTPTTSSTQYTQAIVISGDSVVLKFFAVKGTDVPSSVISHTYLKRDTLGLPVATPPDNTVFSDSVIVTLSHPTVPTAIIRYTTDGSTPTLSSPIYTEGVTRLKFTQPATLKAIAYAPMLSDAYVKSGVMTARYIPRVAPVVADPPSGTTFISYILTQLNTSTPGSVIYYTTDGSTPSSSSTAFTGVIKFSATDTLKAVAVKSGWANSDVLQAIYTKSSTPSTLEILASNRYPIDSLTEKSTSFMVLVTAAEADLDRLYSLAITTANGDIDTITLTAQGQDGDVFVFTAIVPFEVNPGNAQPHNGTVEAAWFDSVRVTWINPNNSSDVVSDAVKVRPHEKNADIYFGDSLSAGTPVTEYSETTDTVYVIVDDQVWNPNFTYNVTIWTYPLFGDNRTSDSLILPLQEIEPGIYGVAIPVDRNTTTQTGDGLLQAVKGDTIFARYTDPVDGETAVAKVNYSSPGEVTGTVTFTDASGTEIPDSAYWSPSEDSLYITYVDDYTDDPQTLTLIVKNTTGTGRVTYDTLVVSLGTPEQQDSIGIWRVAVPMDEKDNPSAGNGVVEVFFLGEVSASVQTHTRNGTPQSEVIDVLLVANPDENAKIAITDSTGGSVSRTTTVVKIVLDDQDFTGGPDTLVVDVQSLGTGDVIRNLMLIQQDDGTYVGYFTKTEGAVNTGDGELTTLITDEIRVTYTDPVYGGRTSKKVGYSDNPVQEVFFTSTAGGSPITSIDEFEQSTFVVVVKAVSLTQDKIDTLDVVLVTPNGGLDTIQVIETGIYTGRYESADIPFSFTKAGPTSGNDVIEGKLNITSSGNVLNVTAIPLVAGSDSAEVDIAAAYVPADSAWAIDGDHNGSADTLFVKFREPLRALPAEITSIDWPEEGANGHTATLNEDGDLTEVSFLVRPDGTIDSSIVVIVLKDNADLNDQGEAFEFGQTSQSPTNPASLTLPQTPLFQGLELVIEDRMGPVLTTAQRLSSNGKVYTDDKGNSFFYPDTLIITFSEVFLPLLDTGSVWNRILLFTPVGSDSAYPVILLGRPRPLSNDSLTWEFILTNEVDAVKPRVGDHIFLNPDAPFQDSEGNTPAEHPEDIEGKEYNQPIYMSGVFNPVEGLNYNIPGHNVVLSFDEDGNPVIPNLEYDDNGKIVQRWFEPAGFNMTTGSIDPDVLAEQCGTSQAERKVPVKYPGRCRPMSAVFVCSDGAYTAAVQIFDNHGKFINALVQEFGKCGELENAARRVPEICSEGVISFLVWNQEDMDGKLVGNGVYIWRIEYKYRDKPSVLKYEKQGIVRQKSRNLDNCRD